MMRRVLAILNDTSQGFTSYVWKAALISLLPASAVSAVLLVLTPQAERPEFSGPIVVVSVGLLLISPGIETLVMWPILAILKKVTGKPVLLAVLSALIWASLHSLAHPIWGLIVAWSFFVFSVSFLAWERQSKAKAIAVTASAHMCQNAIPVAMLLGVFLASNQRWEAFERQIADSSNYVVHQEDNRFLLTFRQPLLTPSDLDAYFKTFARLNTRSDAHQESCTLRCRKQGTESSDQDLVYTWQFVSNRLASIELSPGIDDIIPSALLLSQFIPVRPGEKQRAFSSGFKTPTLDDFRHLFGAPTSTTTNSDLTIVTWKYDLYLGAGFLPSHRASSSWQLSAYVQNGTNRVSEIQIILPLLKSTTKINYEDKEESAIGIGTPLTGRPSHTTDHTDRVISGSAATDKRNRGEPLQQSE